MPKASGQEMKITRGPARPQPSRAIKRFAKWALDGSCNANARQQWRARFTVTIPTGSPACVCHTNANGRAVRNFGRRLPPASRRGRCRKDRAVRRLAREAEAARNNGDGALTMGAALGRAIETLARTTGQPTIIPSPGFAAATTTLQ